MLKYATPNGNKEIKISPKEAKELLKANKAILLDIRFEDEEEIISDDFVKRVNPIRLEKEYPTLPKDKIIITACNTQNRSPFAALFLRKKGYNAKYLLEGLKALKKEFD
ncbi:MAG: rhodanese-like domain-containing protein [Nautiliaceae bacterium]